MQSSAKSVEEYLAALPEGQRAVIERVRDVILANLDSGFAEAMQYGMIGYGVPHSVYPAGYHCNAEQPVPFAALAAQKNYFALYLMGLYVGEDDGSGTAVTDDLRWFQEAWAKTGKKLDMGKSCLRFKKLDDLALDVIAELFRRLPANTFLARYDQATASLRKQKTAKGQARKKPKVIRG